MSHSFIHLRVHSEFALEDSIVRVDELVTAAVQQHMPAVGLSDPVNLFALVKFYRAARSRGIKPIMGADLELADKEGSLTFLMANAEGYTHLIYLVSQCHCNNVADMGKVLQRSWLEGHSKGLLLLLGKNSDVGLALARQDAALAQQRLQNWIRCMGQSNVYLELQRTGRTGDEEFIHQAVLLAAQWNVAVVATNDVRFLLQDEYEVHETRVCIAERTQLDDARRVRRYSEEQYFKSAAQMQEMFRDIPEAIENSWAIAQRCSLEIGLGKSYLPQYPIPQGMQMDVYFVTAARQKLQLRLQRLIPENTLEREQRCMPYWERLDIELRIINQMGFAGYFLIVMDFIQWAKSHGVPVGPGRGSGAGSLVAYALGITDLDPLRYDLLFERFLNPERVSMPDFDIDFCMEGRDRVIDYVADRYGREAVSQIITFGTMAAKAVVRDVARVLGKSYGLADRISKMIPAKPPGITLAMAREAETQLELLLTDPKAPDHEDALEIWGRACKLEGITRGVGKHAGGVLIAPGKLTEFTPIFCDEDGKWVSQYDKDDVEKVGLVKFDFLGLRTLTIIDWAMRDIQQRRMQAGQAILDLELLPLDDTDTYRMIEEGRTTAVFQLESAGMKNLQKKLKPSNFEDLIALVALFRPGPLDSGMVDDFINRKHGRADVAYPDPNYQHVSLQPVLAPTYGVIVYQEQVMQIAQVLAGYTLGAADLLRRAMGKKDAAEMSRQRGRFMEGAAGNGVAAELSGSIFDLMEKFAGYGFNKSHSAAYALLSYQTAWLKLHYPAEFMAAVLSAEMHNTDALDPLIDDCRAFGLHIEPPQINRSVYAFIPLSPSEILYGLGAIKGLGEGPVELILAERQKNGPFLDVLDFSSRLDGTRINRRALEALIRAGCFDGLGGHRQTLLDHLPDVLKLASRTHENQRMGMQDMFAAITPEHPMPQIFQDDAPLTLGNRLQMELDALGLFLSGHPLDVLRRELQQAGCTPIAQLKPGSGFKDRDNAARVAGRLRTWRLDKNGRAQVLIEEAGAHIEIVLTTEMVADCRHLLETGRILMVEGSVRLDRFRDTPMVQVSRLMDLDEWRRQRAKYMRIYIRNGGFVPDVHRLRALVQQKNEGVAVDQTKPVQLRICLKDALRGTEEVELSGGAVLRLPLFSDCIEALRSMVGDDAVEVVYD